MDEYDKHLLKQLATIMKEIEQRGLLKMVNDNPLIEKEQGKDVEPLVNSNPNNQKSPWKVFYNSNIDPEFNVVSRGKTLCLSITKSKKRRDFFRKINQMNNFMFKMNGVTNAIGLVEVSRLNIEKKYPFDVDPPPKNPSESALNKRYIMCRICIGGKNKVAHRYVKIYFSKAWSEFIYKSDDMISEDFFKIDKIWTLENSEEVMLPCKAVYRWDSPTELIVNAPPWLTLVGATKKEATSIWVAFSDHNGKIRKGHLSKKGIGSTLYRCSRKEPWDFYRSMLSNRKEDEGSGIVDLMVALNPETLFRFVEHFGKKD